MHDENIMKMAERADVEIKDVPYINEIINARILLSSV